MNRIRVADAIGVLLDAMLAPFVVPAALLLKLTRRIGFQRLRLCRSLVNSIGILPVRRHYYEPFVDRRELLRPLEQARTLPGIEWNVPAQLAFLSSLRYEGEFVDHISSESWAFRFKNPSFGPGDAEYWYQIVRTLKPKTIIEIGSGQSTIIARSAILKNSSELDGYDCEHICIEPYEAPWLEAIGAKVLRLRLEQVDLRIFEKLGQNDLLFIDSSHTIRPQGDVLTEYLEILPRLRPGVTVHIHDIFSPRDYPKEWVLKKMLLWNEQYLVEGFLTNNREWMVLGALNMLKHEHFDVLKRACPYLSEDQEPGSFYIQRTVNQCG